MIEAIGRFLAEPVERAAEEHGEYLRSRQRLGFDWRPVVVLVAAALLLTLRYYMLDFHEAAALLRRFAARETSSPLTTWLDTAASQEHAALSRQIYWALWQCLAFVPVPVLLIRHVLRDRVANYGAKLRGMTNCWYVYVGMYLLMVPAVLVVSTTDSFQRTYPFLKPPRVTSPPNHNSAGRFGVVVGGQDEERDKPRIPSSYWPKFWTWQFFYGLQFVSLEFFFRGFLVHALRRPLGAYAVAVMMVPYCMIHLGKPIPETLGAILAGLLLGFMSLKTRSIWMGAALHIAVAMTMDLAALAQY